MAGDPDTAVGKLPLALGERCSSACGIPLLLGLKLPVTASTSRAEALLLLRVCMRLKGGDPCATLLMLVISVASAYQQASNSSQAHHRQ